MKNTNIKYLALNYFVSYVGLSMMAKSYFSFDRPPLNYFFLIGLASALLAFGIYYLTKEQSSKIKVLVIVGLAVIFIGTSFLL